MRVAEKNDWEYRTYWVGDLQLTPKTTKVIKTRFPDGSKHALQVEWRKEQHSYSDHGHQHNVTSDVPFVKVELHGAELRVKLSSLDAEVTA